MPWWKIVLIVGACIGGVVMGLGLLAAGASFFDASASAADRNDGTFGGLMIAVIGLGLFLPCLLCAVFIRTPNTAPLWQPYASVPGPYMTPPGATAVSLSTPAAADLRSRYVEWFGWCQREVGGDAIALHAATIAALIRAGAGDSAGARDAGRRAALAASPGSLGSPAPAIKSAKLRVLAMTGAALVPLLQEGETTLVSFQGVDNRLAGWQAAFGVIGYLIAASQIGYYYVTATDRRVIVMAGPQLGAPPRDLVFAIPRSMVASAKYSRRLLTGRFALTRLTGERTSMSVDRNWTQEARRAEALLAVGSMPTPMPGGAG